MGFWALAGASAVGGLANYFGGREAADEVSDAARENNRLQRYMFDESNRLTQDWRASGRGALNMQNALLGITPDYAGEGPGNPMYSYVSNHNDLSNAFAGLSAKDHRDIASAGFDANQDGRISQEEFGAFHFDRHGRGEGRTVPSTTNPAQMEGGSVTGSGDAYDAFQNSGFARSMLETTGADWDRMTDQFGAAGNVLSGSYLNALNDTNRRNTSTAFNNYYSALSGLSGTGANLAQAQGQQGVQLANALSTNNNQAASATGSSYMNAAGAFNNALQNGANLYAYGSGNGWFGGNKQTPSITDGWR